MANWQANLDLTDVWNKVDIGDGGEISIQQLCKIISERLAAIKVPQCKEKDLTSWIKNKKEELVEDFKNLSEDEGARIEDFNYIMNDLYDWADTKLDSSWNNKRVCWIATNF